MTQQREQRHHRKLPVFLGGRVSAVTGDVSRNGFSAEMPAVFLPGSFVHGTVMVEGTEYPFEGTVKWAKPGNPLASVRSRFGVRFTRIPEGLKALLTKPG